MPTDAVRGLRRSVSEANRQIERERHARRHGFAVKQVRPEAGLRLERMAEGVTEIEQPTLAAFALISGYLIRSNMLT